MGGEGIRGSGAIDPSLVALLQEHDRIEPRQRGVRVIEHAQRVLPWLMEPRLPLRLGRALVALEERIEAAGAGGGPGLELAPWAPLSHMLDDVWQLQRLLDSPWNLSAPITGREAGPPVGEVKDQYAAIFRAVEGLVGRWLPRLGGIDDASLAALSTLSALMRLDAGRALLEEISRRRTQGRGIDPRSALGDAEWDLIRYGRDYEHVTTCAQRIHLARVYAEMLGAGPGPAGADPDLRDVLARRLLDAAAGALVLCPTVEPETTLGGAEQAVAALEADPSWASRKRARDLAEAAAGLDGRIHKELEVWGDRGMALRPRLAALRDAVPRGADATP